MLSNIGKYALKGYIKAKINKNDKMHMYITSNDESEKREALNAWSYYNGEMSAFIEILKFELSENDINRIICLLPILIDIFQDTEV